MSVVVVLSVIGLAVLATAAFDEVEDRTRVAGRDNGVSVSMAEFDQVEVGMTRKEVERIFGGEGALVSSAGSGEYLSEIYSWDGDGSIGANANVSFSGGKVIGKAQAGLR